MVEVSGIENVCWMWCSWWFLVFGGGGGGVFFGVLVKFEENRTALPLGRRLALPTICHALELHQHMENPHILLETNFITLHVFIVRLRGMKLRKEKWHYFFKTNCIIRQICFWLASSRAALLWSLWCLLCLSCSVFCLCEGCNPGSCKKTYWGERLLRNWWVDSCSCCSVTARFSLANNSFCKHQVLWTWLRCCWISKFWLAVLNWVGNKSCSSSGSVREELVTLAIVSVFHNSGNFMGYFSLSLSKINVLPKNKDRNCSVFGKHTVWTWGTSGQRGSLQNAPFWELMLHHSGFICVDPFYISCFGSPYF